MVTFAISKEKTVPETKFPYPDCPDHLENMYIAIDKVLSDYKKIGIPFIHRVLIVPIVQWTEAVFFHRRFGNRGVLTFQTQKLEHGTIVHQHWRVGREAYANNTLQAWCIDKIANNYEQRYSLSPYGGKEGDEPFPGYQSEPPVKEEMKSWASTIEALEGFSEIAGGIIAHGDKKRKKVSKRKKDPAIWETFSKWIDTSTEDEGYV